MLTLAAVAADPDLATYPFDLAHGGRVMVRPLTGDDVDALAAFLSGLSPQTRHFSIFPSYDHAGAQALCDAINRYDKLRFVVEVAGVAEVIGLIEFSFGIPAGDVARYASYGTALDEATDCRFGPTLADAYQNRGLGSTIFPCVVDVARRFGKTRILLWGGVLAENSRALRFYAKQGFRTVGRFVDDGGEELLDMLWEEDAVMAKWGLLAE